MDRTKILFGAVILALALAFVFLRPKRNSKHPVEKPDAFAQVAPPKKGPATKALSAKSAVDANALAGDRFELQMNSLALGEDGKLTIKIRVEDRCNGYGDYDLIAADAVALGQRTVTLSLEPISPELSGGYKGEARKISIADLKGGVTETFTLPSSGRKAALGVFFCSDSHHEDRCGNKPADDVGAVIDASLVLHKPVVARDRIYFFQFVGVHDGLVDFFGTHLIGQKNFDKSMKPYLGLLGATPAAAETMAGRVKTLNATLVSLAPRISGRSLELNLPHFLGESCIPENLRGLKGLPDTGEPPPQ